MLSKVILIFFIILLIVTNSYSKEKRIILASTTSTYDSGLLSHINDYYEKKYETKIHVIALGTGQALELAKNGDVDILLTHHKKSEIEFMNNGYGILRYDLMYNDYIIVGPKEKKYTCKSINNFLLNVKKNNLLFVSRGDESGTHKKEKELWNNINYKPINNKKYKKIGQGMGATLLFTNETKGYTLTDRATWISFRNKNNLKIICQNKPPLLNQYGIIAVNPKINKRINYQSSLKYINWIISEEGKKLINNYKINGEQLFFYNYK